MRQAWKKVFRQEEVPSSFLNVEKDLEIICNRLFLESKDYSDYLKRLMVIQSSDCLDNLTNPVYIDKIKNTTLASLKKDGYLNFQPKFKLKEHEQVKSYLNINLDNFTPTKENGYFRNGYIEFDIICHTDFWDLGNFRLRPYKIAGYIDAIMNNTRLTGLGKLEFVSATQLVLNEEFSGLCLMYRTIHGNDDIYPFRDLDEDEEKDEPHEPNEQ